MAHGFQAGGPGRYVAAGVLTIRGVAKPLTLPFTLAITGAAAKMNAAVQLNRLAFGVGQGEWKATDTVPAGVTVNVAADRAPGALSAGATPRRGPPRRWRPAQLVILPTETVYGLAADAADPAAVARLYEAKGRPRFNPLIAHVADLGDGGARRAAGRRAPGAWPRRSGRGR